MSTAQSARSIAKQIAEDVGYSVDDLLGMSQQARLQTARRQAYLSISEAKPNWSTRRIARMFNRHHSQIVRGMRLARDERCALSIARGDPDYVLELEAQLKRLSGADIAVVVASRLDLPLWQAIFLSAMIESYPRPRTVEHICELYEEAAIRLSYGKMDGISRDMFRQFASKVNKSFQAQGLPCPITRSHQVVVLSDEIAPWMHSKFGRPVAVKNNQGQAA